eukprot:11798297-Alexandrium_andersonii.AAC.1
MQLGFGITALLEAARVGDRSAQQREQVIVLDSRAGSQRRPKRIPRCAQGLPAPHSAPMRNPPCRTRQNGIQRSELELRGPGKKASSV